MKITNLTYGKISFITIIIGSFALLINMILDEFSKYDYYSNLEIGSRYDTIISFVLVISLLCSLITGIISLYKNERNIVFPTISISILSFLIIFVGYGYIQKSLHNYDVKKGIITNYGIFEIPTKTKQNGKMKTLYDLRSLKTITNEIPALIGKRFGINYVIIGEPDKEYVELMKIITYPEQGLIRNEKTVYSDTSFFSVRLNEQWYSGFEFEYDYELVQGDWEFEYWYDDRILFSQIFKVILN